MRLISAFTSDTDKALWRLALPMIFSNITVPLLGLVDTAVIGHLDSPIYRGVAIGAVATSFLFMLLLFLRMSTTGLAAQALGHKTRRRWRAPLCSRCCWRCWPGSDRPAALSADRTGAADCRRQWRGAGTGAAFS